MIPFTKPFFTNREERYVADAFQRLNLSGGGHYTQASESILERMTQSSKVFITQSCTVALEMAAILANIEPGDEVIMPSYSFSSTANAFVLRGAKPVFVDIRDDTLNLDETLIVGAITPRTRAIVVVHYAGVSCEMDVIMEIARQYDLLVIEDAAQAVLSSYKGRALGSIGHFGALSFHHTKNITCGEGGALLVNDPSFIARAEIILEKGTNRRAFSRGTVHKYNWCDVGSSFIPSEITAAVLFAQLESAEEITSARMKAWETYQTTFKAFDPKGLFSRPVVPSGCTHNAHIYFLVFNCPDHRDFYIEQMRRVNIHCVFHYVPLHSSPAGKKFGRCVGMMRNTDAISKRLVRLPVWPGLETSAVIERSTTVFQKLSDG
jgi:dTDP-4-amino-4,6-dideoxygalactose transaminase